MRSFLFISYLFFSNILFATNPINQLSEKFTTTFNEAANHEKEKITKACPMITQDLLSMTLHLKSDAEVRFVMHKEYYKMLAEISHIPLTIHNILSKHDWRISSSSQELENYKQLLQEVNLSLNKSSSEDSQKEIIRLSIAYIEAILITQNETIENSSFKEYANTTRPLLEKLLHEAANNQIQQFHQQMQLWKTQYPDETWDCLKVAILGIHGPKDGYVLKQYFQMLRKEPYYEKDVIYVEFPEISDIYSDRNKSTAIAIDALTSNSYQLELSENLMNDATFLQQDVMKKSAKDILEKMRNTGEMN